MRTFVYTSRPSRVVFGTGTVGRLREEVERLGGSRVLLLSGSSPTGASAGSVKHSVIWSWRTSTAR